MKQKQTTHWLKVAVIGIALGFALQFVRAWTEPTEAPPGGNVGAPINTGGNAQTKTGNFTSNGIISAGDQFCLRGVCISAWPSGGGGGGAAQYTCPDYTGVGNICDTTCTGQTSGSSTCYYISPLWGEPSCYVKTTVDCSPA
jgi:hypothetical protein